MHFIAYEVATDEDGMHFVSAFDYSDPERQFAHFDRFHEFGIALDRCNDISEEDEFDSIESLEASGDWKELLPTEEVEDHDEIFVDRTPDVYELLVG